jgi:hypothetical protein
MRRNLCALALLALVVTAILPSPAHAEGVMTRFKGISASLSFSNVDSTGCINTYVDVSVYESQYRSTEQGASSYSNAYVSVYRYDSCQYVYFDELYGSITLANGAFDTRGKLQMDRLVTSGVLYDYWTGSEVPVALDLTWTGTGDVTRGSYNSRGSYPNYRYSTHSVGSNRLATVSGTVVVGDTTLSPDASAWASLSDSQTGSTYNWHLPH